MALYIEINCEQDALGNDWTGVNIEASMRRYADLVTEVVQLAYPDATIETTFQPQMWGARVNGSREDDLTNDENAILSFVEGASQGILTVGNWIVPA